MTARSTDTCPGCGETGSLEFFGSVWLDDVRIRPADPQPTWRDAEPTTWYEIIDAAPATTADDDTTGLMWTGDSSLRCKLCDYEVSYAGGPKTREFFERYKLNTRATGERQARRNRAT